MRPNYDELGFSDCMGLRLRNTVEQQLLQDLKEYGKFDGPLKFDWSESCNEGNDAEVLDGTVENFSGTRLFNEKDELVAEGWMEFIYEQELEFFLAYWEFLTIYRAGKEVDLKDAPRIPTHIFEKIPQLVRSKYEEALK